MHNFPPGRLWKVKTLQIPFLPGRLWRSRFMVLRFLLLLLYILWALVLRLLPVLRAVESRAEGKRENLTAVRTPKAEFLRPPT